jgi:hypothetical protein
METISRARASSAHLERIKAALRIFSRASTTTVETEIISGARTIPRLEIISRTKTPSVQAEWLLHSLLVKLLLSRKCIQSLDQMASLMRKVVGSNAAVLAVP